MHESKKINDYSNYLKSIKPQINKTDFCYGKQGLILFYLYKYNLYSDYLDYQYYNELIEECINDLIHKDDFIGIIEFLLLSFLYEKEFNAEFDLSGIILHFEEITFSYMLGCFSQNDFDGYSGAGYPMSYFLLKKQNTRELFKLFDSFIKKNISFGDEKTAYVCLNVDSKKGDLGITHGLSFIIKIFLDFYHQGVLNENDLIILKKLIEYIKVNYKEFINNVNKYNIVYGRIGLLYSLLYYNSNFNDAKVKEIIAWILTNTSDNKETIYTGNNNTVMYGNAGIVMFYNFLQKYDLFMSNSMDNTFWNSKMKVILKTESKDFCFAEGKIGHYLMYMSSLTNDYSFMNLFFIKNF